MMKFIEEDVKVIIIKARRNFMANKSSSKSKKSSSSFWGLNKISLWVLGAAALLYLVAMILSLVGVDAIAFTAGIGENSIDIRKGVIDKLAILGIKLDEEANSVRGKEQLITTKDSSVPVYIIPTDEEVMIARDTYELIG